LNVSVDIATFFFISFIHDIEMGEFTYLGVGWPSGEVLWENDAAREYQKYGNDKLVFF